MERHVERHVIPCAKIRALGWDRKAYVMAQLPWEYVHFRDIGDVRGRCEVCNRPLRYEHTLSRVFAEKREVITVGVQCAGRFMGMDVREMREREKAAHREEVRQARIADLISRVRATWCQQDWKKTFNGNYRILAYGAYITVFCKNELWRYVIKDATDDASPAFFSKRGWLTLDSAKLAVYDHLVAAGIVHMYYT